MQDFIVYDPEQNNDKLLSEWVIEGIIVEIVRYCKELIEEPSDNEEDVDHNMKLIGLQE